MSGQTQSRASIPRMPQMPRMKIINQDRKAFFHFIVGNIFFTNTLFPVPKTVVIRKHLFYMQVVFISSQLSLRQFRCKKALFILLVCSLQKQCSASSRAIFGILNRQYHMNLTLSRFSKCVTPNAFESLARPWSNRPPPCADSWMLFKGKSKQK